MSRRDKYPLSMMYYHTLLAILMIAAFVLGQMGEDGEPQMMFLHKSVGVLVLVFGVMRIINRIGVRRQIPESVNHGLQRTLEKSVHGLLMLLMLGLPVMGWLTSNAKGYPVSVFGWFNLPTLMEKNMELGRSLGQLHEFGAKVFLILLVLHVAAVILHRVLHNSNVLGRMLPWGK